MVVLLMGVAGAGKTTVGQLLASKLGWGFADADDYHSATNIEKMRGGIPLLPTRIVPPVGRRCVPRSLELDCHPEKCRARLFWR